MPRPLKGSQEAKDAMAKARASRGKPKDPNAPVKSKKSNKNTQGIADTTPVLLETVNKNELVVPQYYAKQLSGTKRKPVRYRLVNPITQERHLATRNGQSVVKISRRATANTVLLGDNPTPIPLNAFSKKDREKVVNQFHLVEVNADKDTKDIAKIPFDKPKSRGRPTKLPKNIAYKKANPTEPKEPKEPKTKKPKKENIKLTIEEVKPTKPAKSTKPAGQKSITDFFLPAPMPQITEKATKDIKTFMDEIKEKGETEGLDYYKSVGLFADLILAGLILKYGNKCYWEASVASEGKSTAYSGDTELRVIFDNSGKITGLNDNRTLSPLFIKSYQEIIGKHLEGCIERGEQTIIIPLLLLGYDIKTIKSPTGAKVPEYTKGKSTHANMLVYRPKRGLVERFEPHGSKSGFAEGITSGSEVEINKVLKKFFEKDMTPYIGKVRFVPPIDICPTKYPKTEGFQALQSKLGTDIYGSPYVGFCSMWSLFFAELALMNPDKTSDEIITEALDVANENPDYLLKLIKGYSRMAEVMAREIADNVGVKDWSFKLEKDLSSPDYKGLFGKQSPEVRSKIADYLTATFLNINNRTGTPIIKPIEPELPSTPSRYTEVEKVFESSREIDGIKRMLMSLKISKKVLQEMYEASSSPEYRNIIDDFMKVNNKDAEDVLEFKYKHFAKYLTTQGMAQRPLYSMALAKILKNNYAKKMTKQLSKIVESIDGNLREDGTTLHSGKRVPVSSLIGSGILDDLRDTFKTGVKAVKKGFDKAKDFASTVITGRTDYQPKGRAILRKYGSEKIKSIELGRDPVVQALKSVLNVISGGEFGKRVEKAEYDDLFHLFAVITLESGKKIMTEKNEVIIISESIPARSEKAEYRTISRVPSITLEQLFSNNKSKMGGKYFTYSAKDNNCQDYLLSMLKSSGIGTEEDYKFVKQDTKQLFEGMPYLRKFANSITGFAGKLDVLISGKGFKGSKETEAEIEDIRGSSLDQKNICAKCIKDMRCENCEMCGGKIKTKDVEKFFRDAGKKIIGKKATKKVEALGEKAGKYITSKKGGLASDLIDYGIPAVTAGVLGGLAGATTGGVGGVAGSAIGSKIGKEYIAPAVRKATGAGVGGGRGAWIALVKKVAKDKGISYKEALSVASAMRKK